MGTYQVYILVSLSRCLYVGSTCDLVRRIHQHRTKHSRGHTAKYRIDRLVYYEPARDVHAARRRERQLKGWTRVRKLALIESVNAGWLDLALDWLPRGGVR